MTWKLNGTSIKEPIWDIEYYKITKSSRSTAGLMNMDLIAKKRKFILQYVAMSGEEMDKLLSIINSDVSFIKLEYIDNGKVKTAEVYCGPIKARKFRSHLGWYWKDITFNLIER